MREACPGSGLLRLPRSHQFARIQVTPLPGDQWISAGSTSRRSLQLLAVPVVEHLDALDHAEAARTACSTVRTSRCRSARAFPQRERRQPAVARAECVRGARAGRARDNAAVLGRVRVERLRHRLSQSRVAAFDRRGGAFVALEPRPRLRVLDEPAQLLEQDGGGSPVPLEHLDPLEPVDHCAGFVHFDDGSGGGSAGMCRIRDGTPRCGASVLSPSEQEGRDAAYRSVCGIGLDRGVRCRCEGASRRLPALRPVRVHAARGKRGRGCSDLLWCGS